MQNLLNDINPEFLSPEQGFIAAFNVDNHCYDLRGGPCCKRRLLDNPEAHRSGWVPIDEIHEEDLHVDVLFFPKEEDTQTDDSENDCSESVTDTLQCIDKYVLMARRHNVPDGDEDAEDFHNYDDFGVSMNVDEIDSPADRLFTHIGIKKAARLAVRYDRHR